VEWKKGILVTSERLKKGLFARRTLGRNRSQKKLGRALKESAQKNNGTLCHCKKFRYELRGQKR
jgi:hypothetical protein